MRGEDTLRDYFDYYLRKYRSRYNHDPATPGLMSPRISTDAIRPSLDHLRQSFENSRLWRAASRPKAKSEGMEQLTPPFPHSAAFPSQANGQNGAEDLESEVEEIILVRKLGSVASLRARRQTVLRQLEIVSTHQ